MKFFEDYFKSYSNLLDISMLGDDYLKFIDLCNEVKNRNGKIVFLGNGASASISSQAATDFSQHAHIRSHAFNDHNLITAFGNDYGYENWMTEALKVYADSDDLFILISSSGESKNILNAASYLKANNYNFFSFTGMNPENNLKKLSDNFLWIDSNSYNHIENAHMFLILMAANLIENSKVSLAEIKNNADFLIDYLNKEVDHELLVDMRSLCDEVKNTNSKLIFIGKGGFSSIASHAATDFSKQSRIKSICFNDHNLLTTYANDFGQNNWAKEALKVYAKETDVLFLMSVSGNSRNLVSAGEFFLTNNKKIITFTGTCKDNSLSKIGYVNFSTTRNEPFMVQSIASTQIFSVVDYFG